MITREFAELVLHKTMNEIINQGTFQALVSAVHQKKSHKAQMQELIMK